MVKRRAACLSFVLADSANSFMERKNLRRIRNASLGQPSALEKGLRSYEMRPKANRMFNLSNVFTFRRFCKSYYGEEVSSVGRATGEIPVGHRFESDTASLNFF